MLAPRPKHRARGRAHENALLPRAAPHAHRLRRILPTPRRAPPLHPATPTQAQELEAKLNKIQEEVPTRIYNVAGSCAGAGSGDFHYYRAVRRAARCALGAARGPGEGRACALVHGEGGLRSIPACARAAATFDATACCGVHTPSAVAWLAKHGARPPLLRAGAWPLTLPPAPAPRPAPQVRRAEQDRLRRLDEEERTETERRDFEVGAPAWCWPLTRCMEPGSSCCPAPAPHAHAARGVTCVRWSPPHVCAQEKLKQRQSAQEEKTAKKRNKRQKKKVCRRGMSEVGGRRGAPLSRGSPPSPRLRAAGVPA